MRFFIVALAVGCTGDRDTQDDQVVTSGDTSLVETADPPHTSDTGWQWPEGLVGNRVDPWVAPLDFFVAEDLDGQGRGPSHLYDGTPTLLSIMVGEGHSASTEAASSLAADLTTLEAAQISLVVLTRRSVQSNSFWVSEEGLSTLEVWSDLDGEIEQYYLDQTLLPTDPRSLLLDGQGNLVLTYGAIQGVEDHARDVANDAVLLWGSD